MKKAVILFSGGLDSTTCLAYALAEGYDCYPLSFDYGQKHQAELAAAKTILSYYGIKQHQLLHLDIDKFANSALTQKNLEVPDYKDSNQIPITYVPARNTIFLSYALGYAEILSAEAIFIGVNARDYSGYPDCRPEYIKAFQNMANLATKNGVEGKPITIVTPLLNFNKKDIIILGKKLNVPFKMTVSCYRSQKNNLACGKCDSCYYRKLGFLEAQMDDPTEYEVSA